ncbi:MAG: GNAT family N-acetyltransferase [Oscillospiraceae bacterium]|nr:GNAT family N-acetyltransferase [Oscillospiraceae bacterium]
MMLQIKELTHLDEKLAVVEAMVQALPDWFDEGTTISEVVEAVGSFEDMSFFVAYEAQEALGFIALKVHNPCTAEIGMMAVLAAHHGKGIGRKLVAHCEAFCRARKMEFLTVKTVDESDGNDSYRGTRAFYHALGFKPLEVFPKFWGGTEFPCLFSVKCIRGCDCV